MKKKLRLSFNAPAVLTFTALCVIVQVISMLTRGESNRVLFSVYRASLLDPLTWIRCVTHVLGHLLEYEGYVLACEGFTFFAFALSLFELGGKV